MMRTAAFKKSRLEKLLRVMMMTGLLAAVLFVGAGRADAHSETKRDNYVIMPGVTETRLYMTGTNKENVRVHILRINKGANVSLKSNTTRYYKKGSTKASRKEDYKRWRYKNWKYSTVAQQAANYNKSADAKGKVVAAVNGGYYLKDQYNGATEGNLIMEGRPVRLTKQEPFFAVLKNGRYTIRKSAGKTDDVAECVGGHRWLVKNDNVVIAKKDYHPFSPGHPCQGIGLTGKKDIIIVSVEGEVPYSAGITWHDLGTLMKQQGCKNAIMIDGGGSAQFLTKRPGDKKLTLRNSPCDGAPRNVASSFLVVKRKKSGNARVSGLPAKYMVSKNTKLIRSKKGIYKYRISGKALKTGFVNVNGETYLFNERGNGISRKVVVGNHTYNFVKGRMVSTSDKKSGKAVFDYCGADDGGKNLVSVYQYKNKKLIIGKNPLMNTGSGRMENWTYFTQVPWNSEKRRIRTVTVGEGVVNLGTLFLWVPKDPFDDKLRDVQSALRKVKLPDSLVTVGEKAFYNHMNLRKFTLPQNVTTLGVDSFAENNLSQFTFKSKRPPRIGGGAFSRNDVATGGLTFNVPDTGSWRSFVEADGRTIMNGTVSYDKQ